MQHSKEGLGDCFIGQLVVSSCKRKRKSGLLREQRDQIISFMLYLSPEGLEAITHSKYSLAAMESSTLFTSLVKVPSTCLLLNVSTLLFVSDLSMYDITGHLNQCLTPTPTEPSDCVSVIISWSVEMLVKKKKKKNHLTQSSHINQQFKGIYFNTATRNIKKISKERRGKKKLWSWLGLWPQISLVMVESGFQELHRREENGEGTAYSLRTCPALSLATKSLIAWSLR